MRIFTSWFRPLGSAIVLLVAGASLQADEALQAPSATELAGRIEARQKTIQDFTATFELRTSSPLLPREPPERGTLKIKKPGRMRQTTDKNELVADGKNIYVSFPRDRYVEIRPIPTGDTLSSWSMFLTGRGDLVRDFSHRLASDQPADEWHVILVPRQADAAFQSLMLQVDRKTLQLRGLVVQDTQETTLLYRFSDLRENRGLSDREFEYKVPNGFAVKRP